MFSSRRRWRGAAGTPGLAARSGTYRGVVHAHHDPRRALTRLLPMWPILLTALPAGTAVFAVAGWLCRHPPEIPAPADLNRGFPRDNSPSRQGAQSFAHRDPLGNTSTWAISFSRQGRYNCPATCGRCSVPRDVRHDHSLPLRFGRPALSSSPAGAGATGPAKALVDRHHRTTPWPAS